MHRRLRATILTVVLASVAWARSAAADCSTDIDCYGATCGSPVCQQTVGGSNCVAAGTDPQGFDGTCGTDADCKCAGEGATCTSGTGHCTFTTPQDAGSAADAGASSGSSDNSAACAVAHIGHGGQVGIVVALSIACAAGLGLARRKGRR
jgi:hypothetical protein